MSLNDIDLNKLSNKAFDWLISHGPNILLGLVVLFAGWWLIKWFGKWLQSSMHKKDVNPSLRPFLNNLIIIALRIMLLMGVVQLFGYELTTLTVLFGGLSVAAGLALSGTLQNFASGVLILLLKPFVVGDNIIAQGQEGTVTSIQIFYTIVTTFDNRTVVIPNGKLSNEVIINISTKGSRRLDIEIKFGYGIDYDRVAEVIHKTVDEFKSSLKTPERRIGISVLEESGYKVSVNIWVKAHGFTDTKLAFQKELMDNLKNSGLKLPGMTD